MRGIKVKENFRSDYLKFCTTENRYKSIILSRLKCIALMWNNKIRKVDTLIREHNLTSKFPLMNDLIVASVNCFSSNLAEIYNKSREYLIFVHTITKKYICIQVEIYYSNSSSDYGYIHLKPNMLYMSDEQFSNYTTKLIIEMDNYIRYERNIGVGKSNSKDESK